MYTQDPYFWRAGAIAFWVVFWSANAVPDSYLCGRHSIARRMA
jgi:hypothetical protein